MSPPDLVDDSLVELSDWELHDFAIQMVRRHLEEERAEILSWTGDPGIDPSLWFTRDGRREWVVVRAVRYPSAGAKVPDNIDSIAASCFSQADGGSFASVAVANASEPGAPLWRGHGYTVSFKGLTPVSSAHRKRDRDR
jgi:hypothetical protein